MNAATNSASIDVAQQAPDDGIIVTFFENVMCNTPARSIKMSWSEFVTKLSGSRAISETKGDVYLYSFASFNGTRAVANITAVSCLVFDFDSGVAFDIVAAKAEGLELLAHTTWSHSAEKPKFRVVVPLARDVSALEYAKLWQVMNDRLGGHADRAARDASRISYWPSCPAERADLAWVRHQQGEYIDPDDPLATNDNALSADASNFIAGIKLPVDLEADVPEGQRNCTAARVVGHLLAGGMAPEAARVELERWNQNRCKPPLDPAELERTFASIAKRHGQQTAERGGSWVPPGYRLAVDGLWFQEPGDDDKPAVKLSGRFEVTASTRDVAGSAWGSLLVWQDSDGRKHQWAMPHSMLSGDGADVRSRLLDGGLYVAPTPRARNFLTSFLLQARPAARARCCDSTGWLAGTKVFVTPGRTFGDTGSEIVVFQHAGSAPEFELRGTLDGWRNEVAGRCAGNSRLVLAVATAFAGPLLYLTGEEGGGIHFSGPSSIGKSTAAHAAASVWGCPVDSWRTTDNGAEGLAAGACDTLAVLDEIGQGDPRAVDALAYMLVNGQGKARMKRDTTRRPGARWRLLFISTGEVGLAEKLAEVGKRAKAGQSARLVEVPGDAGKGHGLFETLHGENDGDAFARRIKAAIEQQRGHAAVAFLEKLTAAPDEAVKSVRTTRDRWLREHLPPKADGQVARVAGRFALIAAAGELAVGWDILPWPEGEASGAAATTFRAWIDRRGGVEAGEITSGIEQVRAFLEAHGSSRFESIQKPSAFPGEGRTINRAGFRRHANEGDELWEYCIQPTSWRNEVCSGYDARAIARAMKEKGWMVTDHGRLTRKTRIPGIVPQDLYVISPAFLSRETP